MKLMDLQNIPLQPQPQEPVILQPKPKFPLLLILSGVIFILLVSIGGYYLGKLPNKSIITPTPTISQQKACTMDAKICPDGSSVGRVLPNCEFAPCSGRSGINKTSPAPTGNTLSTFCLNYLGQPQSDEVCENISLEARSCKVNSDCDPTCSRGCLNHSWKLETSLNDCMAEPIYSCGCLNNICQKSQ